MKHSSSQTRSSSYLHLLLLLLLILPLICLFSNPSVHLYLIPALGSCQPVKFTETRELTPPKPTFRLLMGILTLPSRFERRSLIRLAYSNQQITGAHVDIRFILCNVTKEDEITLVSLEMMQYDDIIILNCTESMNSGKTYTYFSSLPILFTGEDKYDYATKSDDDTYFILNNLIKSLEDKSRHDMYYGAGFPFNEKDSPQFMLGMGYLLSWDLIEWIAESEITRSEPVGPEDMLTGKWLNMGNKARNRYNMIPAMYDYKGPELGDFIPGTIAVHQLKETTRWLNTLKYFNLKDRIRT
ncbi:Hexosyltransferase [Rhynchospora pubera]|uniref:Hexosyltransferase n=1 Tax=Rhynchospora pubera TaxID=906938 RepID=A0AAV8HCG5_9POAL|nr:Hexosyltransferase [Rhynchospora pubera]